MTSKSQESANTRKRSNHTSTTQYTQTWQTGRTAQRSKWNIGMHAEGITTNSRYTQRPMLMATREADFLTSGNPNKVQSVLANHPLQLTDYSQTKHHYHPMSFGLSVFHTIFNLINVVIMIWLTEYYVKICNFLIKPKHKEEDEFQLKYISRGMLNAAELNIAQAQREIEVYADRVNRMFGMVKSLRHIKPETEEFNKLFSRIGKYEEISDRMEIEIANYLNRVVDGRLSYEGKMRISSMLNIVSEIESIADSCNNLARTMVRQHEAKVTFNQIVSANIDTMFKYTSEALENMILLLRDIENADEKHIMISYNKEREINNYRNALRSENVDNINHKIYPYEEGIYYMDIICESERLCDYIVNVVDCVRAQTEAEA